jgi:hypothetical protein
MAEERGLTCIKPHFSNKIHAFRLKTRVIVRKNPANSKFVKTEFFEKMDLKRKYPKIRVKGEFSVRSYHGIDGSSGLPQCKTHAMNHCYKLLSVCSIANLNSRSVHCFKPMLRLLPEESGESSIFSLLSCPINIP